MSMQQQHQNHSRALAGGPAGSRPTGAPAYYQARPASLWLSAIKPARQARRTQSAGG